MKPGARPTLALLLVGALAAPAMASHEDDGLGARAAAMGEAFAAVSGDYSSMAYNPAGLAGMRLMQFGTGFRRAFQTPAGAADLTRLDAGVASPVDWPGLHGALGAFGTHSGIGDLSLDRSLGLAYATRGWRELGSGVLDLGVSLKSLSRSGRRLAGSTSKVGVDIGALLQMEDARSFGLSLLNLNGPRTDIGGVPDRAPVTLKAGYAQVYRGFSFALDLAKREPSAGRRATATLGAGTEYWLPAGRTGSLAARTGLTLGDQSKSWGLGAGWKVLGAEVDYALTVPLASGSRWGNSVSLVYRFGSWDPEREYEKMLGSELRYRQEITRALEAAEVKQWKLAEELRSLREDLDKTRAELASKTLSEAEARDRLKVLEDRQRRAQESLDKIAREKEALARRSKDQALHDDWAAYEKLKLQGAPDLILLERVKQILRDYKDTGVDLGDPNRELLRLLRNRPAP